MTEKTEEQKLIFPHLPENFLQKLNERKAALEADNHEEEKRSPAAVVAEKILRAVNDGHLSSVEGSEAFLRKRAEVEDEPLPGFVIKLLPKENGAVINYRGMQLVTFGVITKSEHTVLYIHGGAYTEEILPFH